MSSRRRAVLSVAVVIGYFALTILTTWATLAVWSAYGEIAAWGTLFGGSAVTAAVLMPLIYYTWMRDESFRTRAA